MSRGRSRSLGARSGRLYGRWVLFP
jgi:hypothetical protein